MSVTTHGYKKYPRSLCSQKFLRSTTGHPCRFGPFILRHDWVTGGTEMHATHRSKRRNKGRIMDAAPPQRISSGRLTSGRDRWKSNGGNGLYALEICTDSNTENECWIIYKVRLRFRHFNKNYNDFKILKRNYCVANTDSTNRIARGHKYST